MHSIHIHVAMMHIECVMTNKWELFYSVAMIRRGEGGVPARKIPLSKSFNLHLGVQQQLRQLAWLVNTNTIFLQSDAKKHS